MNGNIQYALLFDFYVYAVVFFIIGMCIFNKLKHRFAEIL